jgi:hypothetical protein
MQPLGACRALPENSHKGIKRGKIGAYERTIRNDRPGNADVISGGYEGLAA